MRHVPTIIAVLLVSIDDHGLLFIHCLPNQDGRVPDGIETLRWEAETANGAVRLRVLKTERYGDRTIGLTLCPYRTRDRLRLEAARRFAEGMPFDIAEVIAHAVEDAMRFAGTPGWTAQGSRRYQKKHAAERAA